MQHRRKECLRIALVTMAPFPIGNVSTIRYTSYLEALANKGIYTKVIVYTPTTMAKHIESKKGIFKGIHYEYASKITWGKYNNIFFRLFYLTIGLFSTLRIIFKFNLNTVILYGDNPVPVNLFLKLGSKLIKYRFIGDRSEYPTIRQRQSKIKLSMYKFKNSILDGMIVMTKELEVFYRKILKHNRSVFILPMTTDMHRYDNVIYNNFSDPYIAVVFGIHNRDGLYESLKSYMIYKELGGKYALKIIGDFDSMPNKSELQDLISSTKYRIDILGKRPITEVPEILANAKCLLTTPNSYISGGFPTKLGEYLLSGVPVVATQVGELDEFLTDKKDIIFAEAGNFNNIAGKILWIENNPNDAAKIAQNAQVTARECFSADSYADELIDFLCI